MISYQVDECLNSKKLVLACAEEGLVNVRRCPRRLKQRDDPEVLRDVLPSEWSLVTTDRVIHLEHSRFFPREHSGVLIVATSESSRTLSIKNVLAILRKFKAAFSDWHEVSLRNSVVEITEQQAEVWRVSNGNAERIGFFEFNTGGWQDSLRSLLQQNSSRKNA
jgi:hypothetical protein